MNFTKITIIINHKSNYFIGSQIRGALGYALKQVVCINPSYKCEGCFAVENCLYFDFYEKKNSFHQYRLDFELGKPFYEFNLYLFEDAIQQLPYVVSAIYKLLTEIGLSYKKTTFKNFSIFVNDENILDNNKLTLPSSIVKQFVIDKFCQNIILHFVTPLRIKKENRFIRDENITLQDIVNSIYQRQMQLLGRGFKKFPYEIEGEIVKKELYYKELTRKSNRQKTTMHLGGIMGEIILQNINKEVYEVLKLGELIGVGKSTVFGLGKIEVKEIK